MGDELFRWDGQTDRQTEVDKQTDMKNLIVAFRNLANAPKIWLLNFVSVIAVLNLSVCKTMYSITVVLSFL